MAKTKTPPGKKPVDPDEDPEDTEEQEEEQADPEEQNRRINAIVTSRVKREMKAVTTQLTQMQEMIKNLAIPKTPDEDSEDDVDPGESPAAKKARVVADSKQAKQLQKLQQELAEEKSKREQAEKSRVEEHDKSRRQEMVNLYDSALQEQGVSDPKLRRAALITLEQDGLMMRDEDGKVKFKGTDKYGIETNLDPKLGLKSWVNGEGKSFVPAVDAGGSGGGGSRGVDTAKLTKGEFGKLSPGQKASIELERAMTGQPPLE